MNSAYFACLDVQLSLQIFLQQTLEGENTYKQNIKFTTQTSVKYGCIEHFPYSYQDFGVQCPISSKLGNYFVNYITKYGESYYSCSCCDSNNIELTSSPKTWIKTRA